jgi:hypothetical protein
VVGVVLVGVGRARRALRRRDHGDGGNPAARPSTRAPQTLVRAPSRNGRQGHGNEPHDRRGRSPERRRRGHPTG